MIISEKGAKTVFITLVCVSLGTLLGLEVKTQKINQTGVMQIEADIELDEIESLSQARDKKDIF